MFRKPFSYKGRIRRAEFLLSWLISLVLKIGLVIYLAWDLIALAVLLIIPVDMFYHAQSVKRLHDLGWQEKGMTLHPFVKNPFTTINLLFLPGQKGENQYGPNPRDIH